MHVPQSQMLNQNLKSLLSGLQRGLGQNPELDFLPIPGAVQQLNPLETIIAQFWMCSQSNHGLYHYPIKPDLPTTQATQILKTAKSNLKPDGQKFIYEEETTKVEVAEVGPAKVFQITITKQGYQNKSHQKPSTK